jgi:hypothetical protein
MMSYIRGIAGPLPEGERVLWQGPPVRESLTRHAFHPRKVAVYFALMLVFRATAGAGAWNSWVALVACGVTAVGLSYLLGWLSARTSWYAITDHRIIMRTGIVLSGVLNIPLRYVDGAAVHRFADGSGDLALQLRPDVHLAYLRLWPHARAWRLSRPQPAFRSIANVDQVGEMLRGVVAGG